MNMMNKQNHGTFSELIVCCDLLTKGYEVFRSVSSSCSCDLIAQSGKLSLRVEVTSAMFNQKTNRLSMPSKKIKRQHHWDVLAICHNDKHVQYFKITDGNALEIDVSTLRNSEDKTK